MKFGVVKMPDLWERRDPRVAFDVAHVCFIDRRLGEFMIAADGIYKRNETDPKIWTPVKD